MFLAGLAGTTYTDLGGDDAEGAAQHAADGRERVRAAAGLAGREARDTVRAVQRDPDVPAPSAVMPSGPPRGGDHASGGSSAPGAVPARNGERRRRRRSERRGFPFRPRGRRSGRSRPRGPAPVPDAAIGADLRSDASARSRAARSTCARSRRRRSHRGAAQGHRDRVDRERRHGDARGRIDPVTATHTVPSGPSGDRCRPEPHVTRPTSSPAGVIRATVLSLSSTTQKLPSGPSAIPFVPEVNALKSWITAAPAEAGRTKTRARARSVRRSICRPYRLRHRS